MPPKRKVSDDRSSVMNIRDMFKKQGKLSVLSIINVNCIYSTLYNMLRFSGSPNTSAEAEASVRLDSVTFVNLFYDVH